jgi:ribosome-binding ATPase
MIEIGLVGKPSSGKSSFFKAATMIDVKISSVPFTTIEPNTGIAYVVVDCIEKEFNVKCNPKSGYCKNGKRFIPIKLIDVGGLIPGSHEGRGIGNKFLDDLRQASVLIQIVDASGTTDGEGKPTSNYDPSNEIEFLKDEIDLWFSGILEKAIKKINIKAIKDKEEILNILSDQLSGLGVAKSHIKKALENCDVSDIKRFASIIRKISKPIIIAANKIDLKSSQDNFEKLKSKFKDLIIVPTSAECEIALKKAAENNLIEYDGTNGFTIKGDLNERQKSALEFIKNNVIEKYGSTGIQVCLNKAVFEILNYIVVYPVEDENKLSDKNGNKFPDAFLLPKGSTALDLAYKIHTTIGEKFISAIDVRTKKRLGKDYEIKNNDVIKILFSR